MDDVSVKVGDVLSGYRLDAVLGQGGMGCVFLATHQRLGRKVAVKVLADSLAAQSEYVSRFLSEARIVNDVRHPNIVDIFDFIETTEPRRVAYVMEYVEGPSLGSLLKKQRLSGEQAANIALQIASALRAVHAVGVIHRDLKPDNVLVLADLDSDFSVSPSVKILDFGIAKTSNASDSQHKTVTGSILGTPSYMAPEQMAATAVSPATDVYALGEILYEMVSGQRLFRGDQMSIFKSKLIGEVPPLDLPDDLVARERFVSAIQSTVVHEPTRRLRLDDFTAELTTILSKAPHIGPRSIALPRPASRELASPALTPLNMNSVVLSPETVVVPKKTGLLVGVAAVLVGVIAGGYFYLESSRQVASAPRVEAMAPPSAEVAPLGSAPAPAAPPEAPPTPSVEANLRPEPGPTAGTVAGEVPPPSEAETPEEPKVAATDAASPPAAEAAIPRKKKEKASRQKKAPASSASPSATAQPLEPREKPAPEKKPVEDEAVSPIKKRQLMSW